MPVPSMVLGFAPAVGLVAVPQHTPRNVTGDPPSLEIFPPLVAVVLNIEEAELVVSVGNTAGLVVKLISFP